MPECCGRPRPFAADAGYEFKVCACGARWERDLRGIVRVLPPVVRLSAPSSDDHAKPGEGR